MLLSDYPGLTRGVARMQRVEDALRAFSVTPLLEEINGISVRQLTPRHLDLLLLVRSPFLIRPAKRKEFALLAQAEDVAQFIWIVSPTNPQDGSRAPRKFHRSLRPRDSRYFRRFYRAIDRYYDRATIDEPLPSARGRTVLTALSIAFIHRIAAAYGWLAVVLDDKGRPVPEKGILDMPVARLFQFMHWIRLENDPTAPMVSRLQHRVKSRIIMRWRNRAEQAGFLDDDTLPGRHWEGVYRYLVSIGRLKSAQPLNLSTPQPS